MGYFVFKFSFKLKFSFVPLFYNLFYHLQKVLQHTKVKILVSFSISLYTQAKQGSVIL